MKAYEVTYNFSVDNEYKIYTVNDIVICKNIDEVKREVGYKFEKLYIENKNYSTLEISYIKEINISDINLRDLYMGDMLKIIDSVVENFSN